MLGPLLIGVVFFCFFLLGDFFPDYWWSTHFLAFLPPLWKYAVLAVAALLMAIGLRLYPSLPQGITKFFHSPLWIWLIAGLMGFLFYQFPMVQDFYGEAYLLNQHLLKTASTIPLGTHEAFFNYGINPWDGQKTIFALVTYLTWFAGCTYREAFIYFDAFFGVLFVLSWLFFLRHYLTNNFWKVLFGIAGLTAPFMLNYFGHIEINAPVLLLNMTWMMGALLYLDNKKSSYLWGLFFFLFVCIKFHAVALLFAPVWGVLAMHHFQKKAEFFSWKQIASYLLLPIYTVGAISYFFVFKDHTDSRDLVEKVTEYEHLFLPLISPPAPLDTYNMLSFNHLFDYFSEWLLWSPVALFLLVVIGLFYRKEINWQAEGIIVAGTGLLLFGSLFFVVNPLLSMQMDWDLFSMPAPLFLLFTVVLVRQIQQSNLLHKTWGICLALSLLCVPAFVVHNSQTMLSYRLESVGIRIYHTYYEWSAMTIHNALGLLWQDRALQLERKDNIIRKLHPYAQLGNDREYAGLWAWEAKHFLRVEKKYDKALQYLQTANQYDPNERNTLLYFMETYFVMGQPQLAYQYCLKLIEIGYPDPKRAQMAAMQCSLEAGLYDNAFQHATLYTNTWNDNAMVAEIHQRLLEGDRIDEVKNLFQAVQ